MLSRMMHLLKTFHIPSFMLGVTLATTCWLAAQVLIYFITIHHDPLIRAQGRSATASLAR